MKAFMNEEFLLDTPVASHLYHDFAEGKPIVDFHNHLSAQEIYEDRSYDSLGQLWLSGDHYKWRVMRAAGVPEEKVTGNASYEEKYLAFAEIMPQLIGSPIYHWTHLELKRYFGIREPLSRTTAPAIASVASEQLKSPEFTTRNLLVRMNVKELCTTNDPAEDLKYHILLQKEESRFTVRPTFRPERAMAIERDDYLSYLKELSSSCGETTPDSLEDLLHLLQRRICYFDEHGCRISDHSLEGEVLPPASLEEADEIFRRRLSGKDISDAEVSSFKSCLIAQLSGMYAQRGWVMQLHIGAMRNNSSRMFALTGRDTGFDSLDDFGYAKGLSAILDEADKNQLLPRTILYPMNQKDARMLASLAGDFQDGQIPGKMQLGAPWWFNDHLEGIEEYLSIIGQYGVLARFVGMVTDSRSFLSFPRHEYFRRILCRFLGHLVEDGQYPDDEEALQSAVEGICYQNALAYLGLNEERNV